MTVSTTDHLSETYTCSASGKAGLAGRVTVSHSVDLQLFPSHTQRQWLTASKAGFSLSPFASLKWGTGHTYFNPVPDLKRACSSMLHLYMLNVERLHVNHTCSLHWLVLVCVCVNEGKGKGRRERADCRFTPDSYMTDTKTIKNGDADLRVGQAPLWWYYIYTHLIYALYWRQFIRNSCSPAYSCSYRTSQICGSSTA